MHWGVEGGGGGWGVGGGGGAKQTFLFDIN